MRRKKIESQKRRNREWKKPLEDAAGKDDMGKKVRLFQMVLWVGVVIIQMAVVGNLEVRAEETAETEEYGPPRTQGMRQEKEGREKIVVRSDLYQRKEDCPEPEVSHTAEDGTVYPLLSWETESVRVPMEKRLVRREGVCGPVEGIFQIPEDIAVTDYEGWQQAEAFCHLKEKEIVKEEWTEDFSFPVTFHKYDAGIYRLQDYMIAGDEESPQLDGYEELLLREIKVRPEEYQITEILWDGEPYVDETGELCRDAAAYGQKLVRNYRLVYEGTAEFPAYEAWRTVSVYGLEDREENTETMPAEPVVVEIGESMPATSSFPALADLWERITRTLLLTIGIGALLFFAGLAVLAVLWTSRTFQQHGKGRRKRKGEKGKG